MILIWQQLHCILLVRHVIGLILRQNDFILLSFHLMVLIWHLVTCILPILHLIVLWLQCAFPSYGDPDLASNELHSAVFRQMVLIQLLLNFIMLAPHLLVLI